MSTPYHPRPDRYDAVPEGWFRRCGRTGLLLPALSLGCWHNFGDAGTDPRQLPESDFHANAQAMLFTAFDHGITHFDLANNYGPQPGAAELRVGRILREDFRGYRDELIISSKAGYTMWPGPYGDWGSRKYLLASLDQSLDRLGLDYVDIFYSHRPDPETPLEETMGALDTAVRSGKALYAAISNYSGEQTLEARRVCEREGFIKPILHQPRYSMLDRWIEPELLPVTGELGMGVIAFCPLAQGLLTPKYLGGIPDDSRVKQAAGFLTEDRVTPELIEKLQKLNAIAEERSQSLAQLALSWALRDTRMTSLIIGASRPSQIEANVEAAEKLAFTDSELLAIETVLAE
ncbi:aldo/keto reductase [Algisphaera agarilytica]|uniref:L-glyceraldehyde 3-phosphate reductase n=1 Tax=Algisphaera agarilytica TaxID=1385975 RepID=A0A7X0LJM1_9BACT|nr:aldo/keto reductase [Algisphaera agarilytica]MBB6428761.1 L-glyceraldehyde 3-phosphate reductase [Algisphaera agarilytica]